MDVAPPPAPVVAAAVITWLVATGAAVATALLGIGLVVLGAPLWETFGSGADNPAWWIGGFTAFVVALAVLADVAALLMFRGRSWARWVLAFLALCSTVLSLFAASYVLPLIITAASVVVIALILQAPTRAWFRRSEP